jgi:hypothetical protein
MDGRGLHIAAKLIWIILNFPVQKSPGIYAGARRLIEIETNPDQ